MFRSCRQTALLLAAILSVVPAAQGAEWYVAGRGGFVTDTGFGVAGSIGGEWRSPPNYATDFRAELEIAVRRNETDNSAIGYVWSIAEMANVYFDIHTPSRLSPYVGAGIGVVSADNGDDTDHAAAFQGMVGLRWRIRGATSLIGEYRFLTAPSLDFQAANSSTSASTNYNTHNLFMGVAFRF